MHEAATEKQRPRPLSGMEYVLVWGGLVLLTTGTFLLHRVDLGWGQVPVALAIATAKGLLIVWFFMHLYEHTGPSRLAMMVPLVFLAVLTLLSWADLRTRFTPSMPPGPFQMKLDGR